MIVPVNPSPSYWAARITASFRRGFESIIEAGQLIISAKETLPHGEFLAMVDGQLPFCPRTAQRLMRIASDPRILNAAHASHLPACWMTLYELTKLDDTTFTAKIDDGTICPDMERRDIGQTIRAASRAARRDKMAAEVKAFPEGRFSVCIADPPWLDDGRPIGFTDRHYHNHYETMTPAQLCAWCVHDRHVSDLFTPTAFLALWTTSHITAIGAHAEVARAWGFEPQTLITWDKELLGLGYWVRDVTEHVLIATRGKPPQPEPVDRPESLFTKRRTRKHSEKPDAIHALLELWFPEISKIELFARSGREGWTPWGHEAPLPPHDPETGEILEAAE